jgi:CHASE3 domain sensor protein
MGIRQKLLLGYLAIGVIAVGAELFTLNELKKIAETFERSIPEKVQSLTNASREDDLSKLIRYYDEVLTQSARNYV